MKLPHQLCAVLLSAIVIAAWGQAAAAPPGRTPTRASRAEVSIPDTRRIVFTSRINGHRYALQVAFPLYPPPPGGYGVLYVLDGDSYFASAVEAARANDNAPAAIVVGIGYPGDARFIAKALARHRPLPASFAADPPFWNAVTYERMYDLTPPATAAAVARQNVLGLVELTADEVGGADDFLRTIETEVKPRVAALAPVDVNNQAIFGHSVGGLIVVHALFTEPNAFRSFIAASPSLWWNDDAIFQEAPAFAEKVRSGAAAPRVLITVGGDEGAVPSLPKSMQFDSARLAELIRMADMVGKARRLADMLHAIHGAAGYRAEDLAEFPHQSHGISPWPAIGRAIPFAFVEPH